MYYLIEIPSEGGEVKIIKNFIHRGHLMPVLDNYLKIHNIKYSELETGIRETGTYCVRDGKNSFKIVSASIGYLYSSITEQYKLDVAYYRLDEQMTPIINICRSKELKKKCLIP